MRSNKIFNTIKFQIISAFAVLIIPLASLSYFYTLSYKIFNQSFNNFLEAEDASSLLSKVEINIIDLQRNVLIFKETASENSAIQSSKKYQDISILIDQLNTLSIINENVETLENIRTHLDSYKSNFDTVVGMRNQQVSLINNHHNAKILNLKNISDRTLENHIIKAHSESLLYLSSYDSSHITLFKKHLSKAKFQLGRKSASTTKTPYPLEQSLEDYSKNFSTIVSITRHYIYLINVVMTGSANEIFYHAAKLQEQYHTNATTTRQLAKLTLEKQQLLGRALLLIGSALTLVIAFALNFRITRPIEAITSVFLKLSEGDQVSALPGLKRKDEIGLLAAAANVFKRRNAETQELLMQAEKLNLIQTELNEALSLEKSKVERALSIKTDFLANMSHELRTPLNSVIGYTVRLLKREKYDDRTTSALTAIERSGRHLLFMINDILDLSKIDANKLELNIISVNIEQLCKDCINQVNTAAEDKSLLLKFESPHDQTIHTDPGRLTQILLNLLSNSIKYTDSGSVTLKITPEETLGRTQISVIDTGVGIKESDQIKLFTRFNQFDEYTRFKVGQGTGLGLAIVSNLSRIMGIALEVSSEYGKGSNFTIFVPYEYTGPLPSAPD
ncbi:sensor histidine kinase [Teredinibacter franksiae]|uniref:sensor histidine kinase n=1 Tax=Teredinibacter franksiae TaxID=2761453 RepID=UPI0016253D5A|nr:HAMP domain-containing sensor histidine kinase [Teredinibacter franksiae]